jgi:hypothetical protein
MLRFVAGSLAGLVVLFAVSAPAHAQDAVPNPHDAQPERPTVATHAGTVAPGWVEVEAGSEFDRYDDSSRGLLVPVVTKIGLASHAQLSIGMQGVGAPGADSTGFGDLSVGVKWRVADKAPVLGRFAVLPALKMPTGSDELGRGTGTTDAGLLLISSHDFGPVSLDINVGYTHRSGSGEASPKSSTLWTVSLGGPFEGSLGWCAELYGLPSTSGPAGQDNIVATLFGPTYQVRPSLVLDTGVIVPVTGPQPHAVYFGAVWNVGRAW